MMINAIAELGEHTEQVWLPVSSVCRFRYESFQSVNCTGP